jgi:hypothetical protein
MKKTLMILFILIFASIGFLTIPNAIGEVNPPVFSIVNPGPSSNPNKWSASEPDSSEVGGTDFVFFDPSTAAGSTFFVNVSVSDALEMKAWGIGVIYDASMLEFVSAWRPSDHVFSEAESNGATPVAPSVSVDDFDASHKIVKWGYAYLWQSNGEQVEWGFDGSGVLCQIQFKIIKDVSSTWSTVMKFDEEWTSTFSLSLPPPGTLKPALRETTIKVNEKTSTTISCGVSSQSLKIGESLTISGSISPKLSGIQVQIEYTQPDGTTLTRDVISEADGRFSDVYSPEENGDWKVSSSWTGNTKYLGAESSSSSFTVTGKGFPTTYIAAIVAVIVLIAIMVFYLQKRG